MIRTTQPEIKTTDQLRKIAWYGINCTIPVNFQPASIEKNHLLFEQDGNPVFEIKWQKSNSKINPHRIVKELRKKHSHFTLPPELIEPDPASTSRAKGGIDDFSMINNLSSNFTSYPFIWETHNTRARGLVLFCRKCRGISILQFMEPQNCKAEARQIVSEQPDMEYPEDIAPSIIKSFCDHNDPTSDSLTWALFDMHAVLPAQYQLEKFNFQPGHFSMTFKHKTTIMDLHRFSPASFLLNKLNLQQFMESQFNLCSENFFISQKVDKTTKLIDYTRKEYAFGKKTVSAFFKKIIKKNNSISRCRICYLDENNKILAVICKNSGIVDSPEFNKICNHYNII